MSENKNMTAPVQKQDWVRPELRHIEAGSAESQRGNIADGGGGAQGS